MANTTLLNFVNAASCNLQRVLDTKSNVSKRNVNLRRYLQRQLRGPIFIPARRSKKSGGRSNKSMASAELLLTYGSLDSNGALSNRRIKNHKRLETLAQVAPEIAADDCESYYVTEEESANKSNVGDGLGENQSGNDDTSGDLDLSFPSTWFDDLGESSGSSDGQSIGGLGQGLADFDCLISEFQPTSLGENPTQLPSMAEVGPIFGKLPIHNSQHFRSNWQSLPEVEEKEKTKFVRCQNSFQDKSSLRKHNETNFAESGSVDTSLLVTEFFESLQALHSQNIQETQGNITINSIDNDEDGECAHSSIQLSVQSSEQQVYQTDNKNAFIREEGKLSLFSASEPFLWHEEFINLSNDNTEQVRESGVSSEVSGLNNDFQNDNAVALNSDDSGVDLHNCPLKDLTMFYESYSSYPSKVIPYMDIAQSPPLLQSQDQLGLGVDIDSILEPIPRIEDIQQEENRLTEAAPLSCGDGTITDKLKITLPSFASVFLKNTPNFGQNTNAHANIGVL